MLSTNVVRLNAYNNPVLLSLALVLVLADRNPVLILVLETHVLLVNNTGIDRTMPKQSDPFIVYAAV